MKAWFSKMMGLLGFVPRGTSVLHFIKPVEHEIKWTVADSHAWDAFRKTETWKKLAVMSEDSMIQALLPRSGPYPDDVSKQQAFVLGRTMQLDYLAEFAVAPVVPEETGPETDFSDE